MEMVFEFLKGAVEWGYAKMGSAGIVCIGAGMLSGFVLGLLFCRSRIKHVREENGVLRRNVEEVEKELKKDEEAIVNLELKIWDRIPVNTLGSFLPLRAQRRAVIVACFNLKGGVGKTTVTGNLGAALADRPSKSVLALDLDHQQSLTKMCLTTSQLAELAQNTMSTARLFEVGGTHELDLPGILKGSTRMVTGRGASYQIVPARPELEDRESSALVHWLEHLGGEDIRLRVAKSLREACQSFDYILLDCPPRFTTGTVNSLVCADFILAPIGLDVVSYDAIPGLITRLDSLREVLGPKLPVSLGLVLNRVDGRRKISSTFFSDLIASCETGWQGRMTAFKQKLTSYGAYDDAARNRTDGKRTFASDMNANAKTQLAALAEEFDNLLAQR